MMQPSNFQFLPLTFYFFLKFRVFIAIACQPPLQSNATYLNVGSAVKLPGTSKYEDLSQLLQQRQLISKWYQLSAAARFFVRKDQCSNIVLFGDNCLEGCFGTLAADGTGSNLGKGKCHDGIEIGTATLKSGLRSKVLRSKLGAHLDINFNFVTL